MNVCDFFFWIEIIFIILSIYISWEIRFRISPKYSLVVVKNVQYPSQCKGHTCLNCIALHPHLWHLHIMIWNIWKRGVNQTIDNHSITHILIETSEKIVKVWKCCCHLFKNLVSKPCSMFHTITTEYVLKPYCIFRFKHLHGCPDCDWNSFRLPRFGDFLLHPRRFDGYTLLQSS